MRRFDLQYRFERLPHRSPILRGRFHHHLLDIALDEPISKRAQLDGAGPDLQAFEVVGTLDLDVSHRDGQHLLVHVNPRDVVRHWPLLVGAESVPRRINQGRELSPGENTATLNYSVNHARSGSNSCSASIAPWLISTSPLPAPLLCPSHDFHVLSRTAGPGSQLRTSSSAASHTLNHFQSTVTEPAKSKYRTPSIPVAGLST
jgi:hypothetical protein